MADEANNCWHRPYDPRADEGALEHYLRWEIELVRQIERVQTAVISNSGSAFRAGIWAIEAKPRFGLTPTIPTRILFRVDMRSLS
jgi:hypothetical protein